jgi:small conductance mechanosensitive channel
LLRVWIKTAPGAQWEVGREFRLRVHDAFATQDVAIGRPQQTVEYRTLSDTNGFHGQGQEGTGS